MNNINEIIASGQAFQESGGDLGAFLQSLTALASSGKTALGLNRWVDTDKPKMEDFNRDNDILDREISSIKESKADLLNTASGYSKLWNDISLPVESGRWIPTVGFDGGGTPVYDVQQGYYHKIGKMCYLSCRLNVTNMQTGGFSGIARIGGIPFPVDPLAKEGGMYTYDMVTNINIGSLSFLPAFNLFACKRIDTISGSGAITAADLPHPTCGFNFGGVYITT